MTMGRILGLYGLSGSGKTTQGGEWAKMVKRTTGKRTLLFSPDFGGHASIDPLVERGIVESRYYKEGDNPWVWLNDAVSNPLPDDVGLVIFDSFTSIGEHLLKHMADEAAQGKQIGAMKIYRVNIAGLGNIGANNESQYGLGQTFLLDSLHKSTWLADKHGVDLLWTFGEHQGTDPNRMAIIGPQGIGQALTGRLPKEMRYILRMVQQATTPGEPPKHILVTQAQDNLGGMGMCYVNARYPLDADTPMPAIIDPASIPAFWEITEAGQREAVAKLESEGL